MAVKCTNCGGAHPSWDCSKPKGKPADRRGIIATDSFEDIKPEPKREPILSKAKRGRPKTDFNKEEYNRLYMRDLRTIKRLGLAVTVKQYRESLE